MLYKYDAALLLTGQRPEIFVEEENKGKNRPGNKSEQNFGPFPDETGLSLLRIFNN